MKKGLLILIIIFLPSQKNYSQKKWSYPLFNADTAIDYYFGKKIIDPYRNLENPENDQVKTWLEEQNRFYDSIIYNISNRYNLMMELWNMSNKQKIWLNNYRAVGNRIFYQVRNSNDINTRKLVYVDNLNKTPVEVFNTKDINEKTKNVFTLNYYEPSFDGRYIAIGLAPNGNEKATIFIINVEEKQLLSEKIERSRVGNIQWTPDNKGFFYIQEKELLTEQDKKTPYEDKKVKYHVLNTDPKNDKEIFNPDIIEKLGLSKIETPMVFTFPTSDKVLINIVNGIYYTIYYASLKDVLKEPSEKIWKKISKGEDKISNNVLVGNQFYGLSYKNNPDGQLITLNLSDLVPKVLYNASGFTLDDMALTKKDLYLTTTKKATNQLVRVRLKNNVIENIELPYQGSIELRPKFSIVSYYQFTNYLLFSVTGYDKSWKRYISDEYNKICQIDEAPDIQYTDKPIEVIVEETEAPSLDGVMVPLTIIYPKGLKLDGTNPTIIQAYGAYGNSMKPAFDMNRLAWFNHGGVYAIAHVRGGSEKGDSWYKGGLKSTKPNSWKDLIGCAEYLIAHKYTSSKHLAAKGISAGGITVGRAITERPDLFKAALIYVSNLNAIRMENSFNNTSTLEYGTAKDSLEFQYLYEMDVYHHIYEGVTYPSILFTSSKNDARVAIWESAKGVAKMQKVSNGNNIILYRISDKGHYSYPSDGEAYSFLFWQLGHPDFKLKEKDYMFKTLQK